MVSMTDNELEETVLTKKLGQFLDIGLENKSTVQLLYLHFPGINKYWIAKKDKFKIK